MLFLSESLDYDSPFPQLVELDLRIDLTRGFTSLLSNMNDGLRRLIRCRRHCGNGSKIPLLVIDAAVVDACDNEDWFRDNVVVLGLLELESVSMESQLREALSGKTMYIDDEAVPDWDADTAYSSDTAISHDTSSNSDSDGWSSTDSD